jgi:ADP-heptose:LPS heptosyltransferase
MHAAKNPIYNFRHNLSAIGLPKNKYKIEPLDLKLNSFEISTGKTLLKNINGNDKKTICFFTYATGNKCYSKEWWETFYNRLKKEYQDYNLIEILPTENVSQISFQAPVFYSKDIREIGSLIAATSLFIGADSGIMHLACAAKTPTMGLFSVTDLNIFQPYGNNSIGIKTSDCDIDLCIKTIDEILYKTSKIRVTAIKIENKELSRKYIHLANATSHYRNKPTGPAPEIITS